MLPYTPERAPHIIERPRLLAALKGVFDQPVTILNAPAGYGKTTAIAQFVERERVTAIWHTVDETQRDLYSLHLAALNAVADAYPRIDVQTPPAGASPRLLARSIAQFLREQRDTIVYVLDDLHLVQDAAQADAWIAALAAALPVTVRLVVATRTVPSFVTADIVSRGVLPITEATLRFTPDEIELLGKTLNDGAPPNANALKMSETLEGWAAGLRLALQPQASDYVDSTFAGAAPETRFAYLARTLFDAQTPVLQQFLLRASTLTVLSPELLISALAIPNAMALMQEAVNRGMFITPVSGGMAFHGLFRSFLQEEFRTRHPAAWRETHLAIARWHEERISVDEAIVSYLASGEIDEALRLITLFARSFYDQGRYEALFRWDVALRGVSVTSSWLRYLCGAVHIDRRQFADARVNLYDAAQGFEAEGDANGVARVHLMEAHIALILGEPLKAEMAANWVLEQEETLLPEIVAAALRVRGKSWQSRGEAAKALLDLKLALPLYEQYCDRLALNKLLHDLDMAYRQLGQVDDAARCLARAVELCRESPGQVGLANALNQFGYFMALRGELELAADQLKEGLAIAIRTGDQRAEAYLSGTLADLERDRGGVTEASGAYQRALETARDTEPYARCTALIGLATLLRWQGKPEDAYQTIVEAEALAEAHSFTVEMALAAVGRCAVAPYTVTMQAALDETAMLLERLATLDATQEMAFTYAVRAGLWLTRGNHEAFEREIDALHTLMKKQPLVQSAIAELCASPGLYAAVNRLSARYDPLKQRMHALRRLMLKPANVIEMGAVSPKTTTTYRISVRTLGQENYTRDGVLVLFTEWKAESARRLFVSLLVEGPQRLESLALKLFPTLENQKKLSDNFHTSLKRVRAAMGDNIIVRQDEFYSINPEVTVWCDALEFQRALSYARGLPDHDPLTLQVWKKALELYQGDFLPGSFMDWSNAYAGHLQTLYLDAKVKVGGLLAYQRGDFPAAVALWEEVLKVDPFREDVHRHIMIAFRAMGRLSAISTHNTNMIRLWQRELGAMPSPETIELVKNLLK